MISIDKINLSFGGFELFKEISFLINPKDRIGLIGKNGAGKTTLLKIITGKENPSAGNVGIDPRLFVDLGDKLSFENSMRQFYPTANTSVPNDQTAFAEFCYGNMPSCKEGDGLQCIKDNPRWINY